MAAKKSKAQPQHLRDINELLSSPAGARFIWTILERTGLYRTSFSSDPLVMAMHEGQRNIGLRLFAEITEACPEKYINLLKSSKARREKANEDAQEKHVVEAGPDHSSDSDLPGDGSPR